MKKIIFFNFQHKSRLHSAFRNIIWNGLEGVLHYIVKVNYKIAFIICLLINDCIKTAVIKDA